MNNNCGTCIGGEQMLFGCYSRCQSCGGTGKCKHVFGRDSHYEGKQWNTYGTREVPKTRITFCNNCGAYKEELLDPNKVVIETTIKSHNWY